MVKNFTLVLLMLFVLLFVSACPPPAPVEAGKSWYDTMIERSLISGGNNYRLKQVITKAKSGADVNIAFIGGSITEGAGATSPQNSYGYLAYQSFQSLFTTGGGSNVHFINAGMSGTPSTLGVIRYKRDVLDRATGSAVDLVFVEFAVNDLDDPTNGATYESLVRNILDAPNAPAVVLLFSVFPTKWNLQDRFIPIGNAYNLPMISIKDAVVPELNNNGNLTNDKFFADIYHPNNYGHKVMADCITYYFTTVNNQTVAASDITLPSTAAIGTQFCGIKMLDNTNDSTTSGVTITAGNFSGVDSTLGTMIYDYNKKTFANNWYKNGADNSTPFTMTLTCKNLLMTYKRSSSTDFGAAEITVDGATTPLTFSGYNSGGWNNPWTVVLFDNPTAASHTISIQMSSADAAKSFSILTFGYTE